MNLSKYSVRLIVGCIILILYLPKIFSQGMFLDGIVYASISRNISLGIGNFFHPIYIPFRHFLPHFSEHLPLSFYLQSLFFKVLGDHYWVENTYSIIILLLTVFTIRMECKNLLVEKVGSSIQTIAIILFLSSPIVVWTYSNNMLEGTMLMFAILSNIYYVKGYREIRLGYLILASFLLLLSFFSKGLTGLFPLMTPIYLFLLDSKTNRKWIFSITGVVAPILMFWLLYVSSYSLKILVDSYFNQQVLNTLVYHNAVNTASHFDILFFFCSEMSLVFGFFAFVFLLHRFLNLRFEFRQKEAYLPALIGLTALLPLCISLRQHNYYLVPSMYYFILALTISFESQLRTLHLLIIDNISQLQRIKVVLFIMLSAAVLVGWRDCGGYRRDEKLIKEIESMGSKLPKGSSLSYSDRDPDWKVLAYMNRLNRYSIQDQDSHSPYRLYLSHDSIFDTSILLFEGESIRIIR